MVKNITPVKDEKQDKFSYVRVIREAMDFLGWKPAELSRRSGVTETDIHRMIQLNMDIRASKVFSILLVLGLVKKMAPSCSVGCGQEIKKLCRKVKKVIESETDYSGALESNIHAFDKAVEAFHYSIEKEKSEAKDRLEMNERIKELEKAMQAGRSTDTDAVASSNIGKQGT